MTLPQLFDLSFTARRDRIALEFEGREYTFGDIDLRSNRMANLLRQRGYRQGDRLCLQLPNSPVLIDFYLACVKLGIVFTPINVLYRDREVTHIVNDAAPRDFITPEAASTWSAAAEAMPSTRPRADLNGDTPAGIIYTSGTTGTSKGAVLTHNNFASNAINLLTCWQITADDRFLLALPLFHVHALGNGLHCWLLSGCRMRLLERFEHAKAPAEFAAFRPTLFFGVPTVYVRLLDFDDATAKSIGATMRLFISGSAPLPAQTLEDFRAKYGHTILERYGMSETLMNLSNPYAGERRPGSVGFPLPGISIRLWNESHEDVPDGETGEVYLKGPNLFAGYWGREEATVAAHHNGWFKTGDLAVRSPDGYYTLSGRRSDLIISGGFNIYPREIEEFLAEIEGIIEAAVIARPDRVRGEVPIAYVVGEFDPTNLEAQCREKLASFKIPRAFHKIEKLPRNAMGKVQKNQLK